MGALMARKLFDTIKAATTPTQPVAPAPGDQPRIRSARSLRGGLLEMSANSVRDIDPDLILSDGPQDRLLLEEEGIRELAESIREHGQHVPILVRPADEPDRYRVVYGRRRLAAARLLGVPVKALIRNLDDRSSVVAQGQENSLRLNPSFIEKAVFVAQLRDAGYESGTIQEALGINRQTVSLMTIVQQAVPMDIIRAIGPAHDVGRRRWMELADAIREHGIDVQNLYAQVESRLQAEPSSDARFDIVSNLAAKLVASPAPRAGRATSANVTADDGTQIGAIKASGPDLQLIFKGKDAPDFVAWAQENAEDVMRSLYAQWRDQQ